MRVTFTKCLAVAILASCNPAQAGGLQGPDVSSLHGVIHGLSHHFSAPPAGERPWNERNIGAGIRYALDASWSLQAGGYRNSYGRPSFYALADWTPLEAGAIRAGAFAGIVSGYDWKTVGAFTGAAGLVARLQADRAGLALRYTPPHPKAASVLAVEFSLRF